MLRIDTSWLEAVATASRAEDLYPSLQGAIELEHATIPVYLSALFSLKPGAMPAVRAILAAIARQEMLHMAIAANVLTALGGAPKMTGREFVPSYPGHLPMNINGSLVVHLGPLTLARIRDEFLEIEEPEHPLVFPEALEAVPFATIGQFYGALIARIRELDAAAFSGDPSRQVADARWFGTNELFAIVDVRSAVRALEVIVEQGEGTTTTPLDQAGDVAHYYRFQEILHGRRLIVDRSVPEGFAYRGEPVPFDPAGVWDMVQDARLAGYAPGSRAATLCGAFNGAYTALLNTLHATFNGQPQMLDRAMGLMFELKVVAGQLTATIDERTGKAAAPSFEYAI
jgi:Ferritin-like